MAFLRPLLLQYYITEQCNCRCRVCDIWSKGRTDDAALAVVVRRLHEARRIGVRFVDFTGGEPLLHPQLPEMLRAAQACGLKTTLTTNTLLYPQRCKELAGLVHFLHFSLDGAKAEVHNSLRGAPAFDRVLDSLDLARCCGERPDITFTVGPHNLEQLPPLSRIAGELRLILIVNPVFRHQGYQPLSEQELSYIEEFSGRPYVYINTAFHRLLRQGGNQIGRPRCRVMDSVLVISPDDRLLAPCYHFVQETLQITDLVDSYHSDWFRALKRQQGAFPPCAGCSLNCYFDPSFHYVLDRFFLDSLSAKLHYVRYKYLSPRAVSSKPAAAVFHQITNEPC
ncbi:MAG: Cyclic pyranopterin monophosphate synthase 1 [bacterium ADurb.Bin478]|nr:MAG: Cyclic pyranopterin monophosphate synthase 1 [bacterium ADurb.Bin478]